MIQIVYIQLSNKIMYSNFKTCNVATFYTIDKNISEYVKDHFMTSMLPKKYRACFKKSGVTQFDVGI